jgi:hypothetical protein
VLWEYRFGPIPPGKRLRQVCDGGKTCIEPTHWRLPSRPRGARHDQ